MDQEKIGKFIAACRKEKGLTQAVLGEKLGITNRAVSKWETGRCMPELSVMPELCDLLGISVSELFKGERIAAEKFEESSNELLLEMRKLEENSNKKLLSFERFLIILFIPVCVLLIISGALIMSSMLPLGIILMASGFATIIICAVLGLKIEHDAGYYECPNCGERYVPTMKAVVMAPHIGTSRKMKCPKCGQKGYHKKAMVK